MLEIKGLTARSLLFSSLPSISHNSRYCLDPTCCRPYLGEMIQQKYLNYLDLKYPKSNPITLITSNSLRGRIFHHALPHYMNPILPLLPHQTRPRASITTPFPDPRGLLHPLTSLTSSHRNTLFPCQFFLSTVVSGTLLSPNQYRRCIYFPLLLQIT